jgi:hypothetical protein
MMLVQMLGVGFLAVEDAFAGGVFGGVVECAEPAGEMEMLGGFVAFPVGFAAEGFGAVRECAAVGAFVAFLMFSRWWLLDERDGGGGGREGGSELEWLYGLTSSRSVDGYASSIRHTGTNPVSRSWVRVVLRMYRLRDVPGLWRGSFGAFGVVAG